MFHVNMPHADPTDLIRNVNGKEAAALVPFYLTSDVEVNELPYLYVRGFALPCQGAYLIAVFLVESKGDVCLRRLFNIS